MYRFYNYRDLGNVVMKENYEKTTLHPEKETKK